MRTGGCDLVPFAPTGAAAGMREIAFAISDESETTLTDSSAARIGVEPRKTWESGHSSPRLQPLSTGSCPKCGRRKIRRKPGRKWCPRCGPLTVPAPLEKTGCG